MAEVLSPRHSGDRNAIDAHWAGDVLDLLIAHVIEGEIELVPHLVAHHSADADPTRLGERPKACGNIDTVAEDIPLVDDDVADIDPHAELDAPFRAAPPRPAPPSHAA